MHKVLDSLQASYPELKFTASDQYCWSPESREIMYNKADINTFANEAVWSLLHETGHALLQHQTYHADIELLRLEVDAWERAKLLARELDIHIDEDHIQDCLDTYRDWLDKRSICPSCNTKSIQNDAQQTYTCYNCHTTWRVTANRFCRVYRDRRGITTSEPIFI